MTVAGFTSTGSKRPAALFGPAGGDDLPLRMSRCEGARLWDDTGSDYLDFVMALGAVTLGYGHPAVRDAARAAVDRGVVGSLAPVEEELLAERLRAVAPWVERVRFLKTGAEAVAAAIRLARASTGRASVLGCGYHGWLDLASREAGVPEAVRLLYDPIPFGDAERARSMIREVGDGLAAVVVEPVVDGPPPDEWLHVLRAETQRVGAVLVFDEIKTGFRVALGGAVERWGVVPDLVVYGKALANGFPLAAVGGRADLMEWVGRTWISSTLATEFVSLAAARASVDETERARVPDHLRTVGGLLERGLRHLAAAHPGLVTGFRGIAEMGYLAFVSDEVGGAVAVQMAHRGILFKRTAYNFVSLAHTEAHVSRCLAALDESLGAVARRS